MKTRSPRPTVPVLAFVACASLALPAHALLPPTVSLSIQGCPDPCSQDVLSPPGITTLTYAISVANNNSERVPLVVDLVHDVPANAVAFRVVDKGNGQACPGWSGATCANVPAPGGANGTGQVVIESLTLGPVGSLFPAATILVEVDFVCPPLTDGAVVTLDPAQINTPNSPSLCTPCLTNPSSFTTRCLPPPSYELTKTVDIPEWKPGDPTVANYTITLKNLSPTQTMTGRDIHIEDTLPYNCAPLGCNAYFRQDLSCPITPVVTPTPVQPMFFDNRKCTDGGPPLLEIWNFPDLAPGQSIQLDFPLTFWSQLADGLQFCNKAQVFIANVPGYTSKACMLVHQPDPVEFKESYKEVDPALAMAGDVITYTLHIVNSGATPATNVQVTDPFDVCLDYSSFVASRDVVFNPPGGSASFSGGTLTLNMGTIAPVTTHTVTVTGLKAGSLTGACCNLAAVTSTEVPAPGRPVGRSPGGTDTPRCFVILAPPPPSFKGSTKSALPTSVALNQPITYTLAIQNAGTGSAHNVVVRDSLAACLEDAGFDPLADVSVAGGPFTAFYNARTLTVNLGTMNGGEVRTVTVSGLSGKVETAACCNQAYITADEIASPGDVTESTSGAGDPTCVPITAAVPLGCDLDRQVTTTKGPAPWVFTIPCTGKDPVLPGPPVLSNLPASPSAVDVEPLAGGAPGELSVYQFDCDCADSIALVKDRTAVPPSLKLKY